MIGLESLVHKINNYLSDIDYGAPKELYDPIVYTLENGGKRIRSILVLLAYGLFREDHTSALPLAASIEVFHNFTLLHDDIMDEAPVRRGRTSVYKQFGQDRAILSGDMMLILSYQLLHRCEGSLSELLAAFNKVGQEVCEGQQMDMLFEERKHVEVEEYIEMIRLKTAVLLASALKMGGILAEAPPKDQERLYNFGINLGLAFQIQDDYLDSFGDPEQFGKQLGGDILQGKKTILYLMLLDELNESEREVFDQLYLSQVENKVEKVLEYFRTHGIDRQVLSIKKKYEKEAKTALEELQEVNEDARKVLNAIMESLSIRKK